MAHSVSPQVLPCSVGELGGLRCLPWAVNALHLLSYLPTNRVGVAYLGNSFPALFSIIPQRQPALVAKAFFVSSFLLSAHHKSQR